MSDQKIGLPVLIEFKFDPNNPGGDPGDQHGKVNTFDQSDLTFVRVFSGQLNLRPVEVAIERCKCCKQAEYHPVYELFGIVLAHEPQEPT